MKYYDLKLNGDKILFPPRLKTKEDIEDWAENHCNGTIEVIPLKETKQPPASKPVRNALFENKIRPCMIMG